MTCYIYLFLVYGFDNSFLLVILFIYISMLSPFPVSHLQTPYPIPLSPDSMRVLPASDPVPPHHPGIPLHWSIEPSQNQGPLLPLMSNKAIIWTYPAGAMGPFICWWFSPSELWWGGSCWLILLFFLWGCKPL